MVGSAFGGFGSKTHFTEIPKTFTLGKIQSNYFFVRILRLRVSLIHVKRTSVPKMTRELTLQSLNQFRYENLKDN